MNPPEVNSKSRMKRIASLKEAEKNNPPEKIYVDKSIYFASRTKKFGMDIEYHLAPQWHDAVKDPPKEDGVYLVISHDGNTDVLNFISDYGGWIGGPEPDMWMLIPEPPKESEG